MDFELEHLFAVDVSTLSATVLDEDFQASLHDIGALERRELLSQEGRAGGVVIRRVRCVLGIDISGAARRFIGDGDPAWVEEAIWDPATSVWTWKIHPEVASHLLHAEGVIELEGRGEHSARRVAGRVKVSVPFYGGKVEGFIVQGIERAYDEEAARLASWLDQRSS